MGVYVSTLNFGSGSLSKVMGELDQIGYPAVEISSGHPAQDDSAQDESVRAVLGYATRHKASIILHNYAPPAPGDLLINLSDPDPGVRDSVTKFLKSRIDLTKELGSDYYSFHGGYRVPYKFGVRDYTSSQILERELALEIYLEALKEVVAHAEAQKVHVGVENHAVQQGNEGLLILFDQADFKTMFDEVNSDYVHLHLDVGHLKVTCETLRLDPHSFVEAFRHKIMAVHLHDNDGRADRHQAFGEDAWFMKQLRRLPGLRYMCLETRTRGDRDRIDGMVDLLGDLSPG